MDLNSPIFDRIRVKQETRREEPATSRIVCDYPGCAATGEFRAPMGRLREGQYFCFCLDHVREYNATYNYFGPYCATNATVTNLAMLYYQDQRNCDDPTNKSESWDQYNVHSVSIENSTTLADIQTILADTIATNGWTVLTFHEVGTPVDPADPTYTISVPQLTAIAQAVKDSGVTVVSTEQGLNESIG